MPERLLPLALLGFAAAGLDQSRYLRLAGLLAVSIGAGALLPVSSPGRFSVPAVFIFSGIALIGGDKWRSRMLPPAVILTGLLIGHDLWRLEISTQWKPVAYLVTIALPIAACLLAGIFYRPWLSIPMRIGGSWLLAIGVIFLAVVAQHGSAPGPGALARTTSPVPVHDSNLPHIHGPNGEVIYLPTGHSASPPVIGGRTNAIGKALGNRNQP